MNSFRKALLVSGMLSALVTPALAVGPTEVTVSTPQRVATYSAAIFGLAPAASATDFVTLIGSATQVVRVKMIECSGTTTASASIPLQLVRRSAIDTTPGTSTTPPVVAHDTNDAAGTAVMRAYTANPAALGAIVGGPMRTGVLSTPSLATSTIDAMPPMNWSFGSNINDKEIVLRGVAQTLAINAGAASFSAGAAINCDIEWTESPT